MCVTEVLGGVLEIMCYQDLYIYFDKDRVKEDLSPKDVYNSLRLWYLVEVW